MSLHVPVWPVYNWMRDVPVDTTQPSTFGATLNPPNTANTYGSYSALFSTSDVANDVWMLSLFFHSIVLPGTTTRDMICTIGVDPAGGSSYSALISDLIVSGAAIGNIRWGVHYAFPIHIKAASSIGWKVSQNSTNTSAIRCAARLYGLPAYPEATWKGTRVETLGANTAASNGTSITQGGANHGSWVTLGTTANDGNAWWQIGMGLNQASATTNTGLIDLAQGAAGSERILIPNHHVRADLNEAVSNYPMYGWHYASMPVPAGQTIRGRMQSSSTTDTTYTLAAYGVS